MKFKVGEWVSNKKNNKRGKILGYNSHSSYEWTKGKESTSTFTKYYVETEEALKLESWNENDTSKID